QTSIWAFVTRVSSARKRVLIALARPGCVLLSSKIPGGNGEICRRARMGCPLWATYHSCGDPFWDFHKLGEKYGDIFSVNMGSQNRCLSSWCGSDIKKIWPDPRLSWKAISGPMKLFNEDRSSS
ncbi:hypothetical protein JTE90_005398, partial [Oedothorax gibbosus]